VSGTDVYVAGQVQNSNGFEVATIWKNGVATSLTDGTKDCYATSVYLKGTDVYAVGGEINGDITRITLWKNGVETYITDGTYYAQPYNIVVK